MMSMPIPPHRGALRVDGLPDLAHAALAEEGGHVVVAEAGASFQGHEFVRDKALEFLGALEGSDLSRFRLFILFLLLLCCVLCGSLLLALILVPLTTFVSHCMSPLFADAHELDCPAVDGSVMQHLGQLRSNRPYCLSEALCAHSGNGRQPTELDAAGGSLVEGSGSSLSQLADHITNSSSAPDEHAQRLKDGGGGAASPSSTTSGQHDG